MTDADLRDSGAITNQTVKERFEQKIVRSILANGEMAVSSKATDAPHRMQPTKSVAFVRRFGAGDV